MLIPCQIFKTLIQVNFVEFSYYVFSFLNQLQMQLGINYLESKIFTNKKNTPFNKNIPKVKTTLLQKATLNFFYITFQTKNKKKQ